MVYTRNTPLRDEVVAASQPKLLGNFQGLASLYDLNHYTWDDPNASYRGLHRFSTYISQGSDPTVNPDGGQVYCKMEGGVAELFFMDSAGNITRITKGGGVEPVRAWGYFSGSSPVVIAGSSNITSIVYSGGVYTVTMTNPAPSANYAVVGMSDSGGSGSYNTDISGFTAGVRTTTQFTLIQRQEQTIVAGFPTSFIVVGG